MEIDKKIQEAIQKNSLVIFVGSGLSNRFKLPSWTKMTEDIIYEIGKDTFKQLIPIMHSGIMTPFEVLDKLKSEHNIVRKFIKKTFDINKTNDFSLHKSILLLTDKVVTTNYDNAFEIASSNSIQPTKHTSTFNVSEINRNDSPYIFKLHGCFSESDSCLIFSDDYNRLYSEDNATLIQLKSIFMNNTILFVGFSFNDNDINKIFGKMDEMFDNNNKHFVITKEPKDFNDKKYLQTIEIKEYNDIDLYIKSCLDFKNKESLNVVPSKFTKTNKVPKIVFLTPKPIDLNLSIESARIHDSFNSIDTEIYEGALNIRTLQMIEDFDLIVLVSEVYKSKLYIEDDNLKSNLLSVIDICSNIPNDNIPIIFITNKKIELPKGYPSVNIFSFKKAIVNRFIHKSLKGNNLNFQENEEICIGNNYVGDIQFLKGIATYKSLYGNDRDLDIGRKCLTNLIGRIEEQSSLASKLISIIRTNKLLNVKASGGTGKTTIIKKVSYDLYNRGYFTTGVNFRSCENVKSYKDFEDILINGFNLSNILNFKEYLIDNYSSIKIDLLIILDNFETIVNNLDEKSLVEVADLLKFASDYANIAITSRDRLLNVDDFEDLYSLTPLVTDDAFILFTKHYGPVEELDQIRILRQDILEDLLNNNPLAIKLVTSSRTRLPHISLLRDQLKEHFFESVNEDFTSVFKSNADLNIERTKSIYQSINYSYTTLNQKQKIAFELLSLFPDGISLSNFKKCFERKSSSSNISDNEMRILRDKSLIEDYNGTLQLQPIIRRFAEHHFFKRPSEQKRSYCLDAYVFNCHVLRYIEFIERRKNTSEALKKYYLFKNNFLKVLSYISEIEIVEKGAVTKKQQLLNYLFKIEHYIVSAKDINEFLEMVESIRSFFSDVPNANTSIKVLNYNKQYFYSEFDNSYKNMSNLLSVDEMEKRIFKDEDVMENRYKGVIAHVHNMEGYTIQQLNSFIKNNYVENYLVSQFFYLGITNNISREKYGFYYFEYELMLGKLNILDLEKYISSLHPEEHLEIMQCTYTLSKVKNIEYDVIKKLVITNPYTKGLQQLMFAFTAKSTEDGIKAFDKALKNLTHIKYYYVEALFQYCLFLKQNKIPEYVDRVNEGLDLTKKYYYQYLNFLFRNIDNIEENSYENSYEFYPLNQLESFVKTHNEAWEVIYKKQEKDYN